MRSGTSIPKSPIPVFTTLATLADSISLKALNASFSSRRIEKS